MSALGHTIVVLGSNERAETVRLLRAVLPADCQVLEGDPNDPELRSLHPHIAVLVPWNEMSREHDLRRFLRVLDERDGIVVAHGRSGMLRKACRGFRYRFRWYDEARPWPGLAGIAGIAPIAAARVAHELGMPSRTIQELIRSAITNA